MLFKNKNDISLCNKLNININLLARCFFYNSSFFYYSNDKKLLNDKTNYINIINKKEEEKNNKKCNLYFNSIFEPINQKVINYFNKIKNKYIHITFKYNLYSKSNRILLYSGVIGLSFITLNLGIYIKRKNFENKLRKYLINIINNNNHSNIIHMDIIRPLFNKIIEEAIKSSIILLDSKKAHITKYAIDFLKDEKNQEIIFELIRNFINYSISNGSINIYDLYNVIKNKNNNKEDNSIISKNIENIIIKILKSKKFEEYISERFLNLINDNIINTNIKKGINLI